MPLTLTSWLTQHTLAPSRNLRRPLFPPRHLPARRLHLCLALGTPWLRAAQYVHAAIQMPRFELRPREEARESTAASLLR
jgi:hypothetical protein